MSSAIRATPAPATLASNPQPVGLDFQETMNGTALVDGKSVPVTFKLKAHIPDIDGYTADPRRAAQLQGTVKVGNREVPVSGTLNLMELGDPTQGNPGHYLEYRLETPAGVNPPVRYAGTKQVKDDRGFDLPADLTSLRGNFVAPGVPLDGKAEAKHPSVQMKFDWKNPLVMARFLASFHAVQGGRDAPLKTPEALAKFAKVVGGGVLSEFTPIDAVEKAASSVVNDVKGVWDKLGQVLHGEWLSPQSAPPIRGTVADDVSLLNKTKVNRVYRPKTVQDVQGALAYARANGLKVSMAGARHSMGGQTLAPNGVLLDMTDYKQMSVEGKTLRVQAGAMWSDVQKFLDDRGLSVDVMQTPSFFTVGGTLGANAHGSNPDSGPFSSTVESFRIMLPSGEVKQASRTENPDLFKAAIGGYGLFGVVLDVDIKVRDNEMYKYEHKSMDVNQYASFYKNEIEGNDGVGYLHALFDVSPGKGFLKNMAVYEYTKDTGHQGPLPKISDDWMHPVREVISYAGYRIATGAPLAKEAYWEALDKVIPAVSPKTTSRNMLMNEAFDGFRNDVSRGQTQIFQEYFIPRENITGFVEKARGILQRYDANLAVAALRGVKKDDTPMMGYSTQKDVFGFVMALQHDISDKNNEKLARMTGELVDAANQFGGRQYLTYQLAYTPDQLRANYPETDAFLQMKQKYDPGQMFQNKWFQKYGDTSKAEPMPAPAPFADEGPIDWNAPKPKAA